ncbi:MAG: hypothetical protein R3D71_02055 [Rickettsiales bacterium]
MEARKTEDAKATDSQMAVMEGAIALAWADGNMDSKEEEKLQNFIKNYIWFSDEQRGDLLNNLSNRVKIDDVWGKISDKQDRAHLLNIASIIFRQDGKLCKLEQETYDRIYQDHMSSIDVAAIKADIREEVEKIKAKMAEAEEEDTGSSISEKIAYYFKKHIFK